MRVGTWNSLGTIATPRDHVSFLPRGVREMIRIPRGNAILPRGVYQLREAGMNGPGRMFWWVISYLGMKSWDLHVCDHASTITHVDRVKKSNPWYNKIWLYLNVTIWSSQICLPVIFIHFVKISKFLGKKCTYSHFFQSPVTASAYFWSALKAC